MSHLPTNAGAGHASPSDSGSRGDRRNGGSPLAACRLRYPGISRDRLVIISKGPGIPLIGLLLPLRVRLLPARALVDRRLFSQMTIVAFFLTERSNAPVSYLSRLQGFARNVASFLIVFRGVPFMA